MRHGDKNIVGPPQTENEFLRQRLDVVIQNNNVLTNWIVGLCTRINNLEVRLAKIEKRKEVRNLQLQNIGGVQSLTLNRTTKKEVKDIILKQQDIFWGKNKEKGKDNG